MAKRTLGCAFGWEMDNKMQHHRPLLGWSSSRDARLSSSSNIKCRPAFAALIHPVLLSLGSLLFGWAAAGKRGAADVPPVLQVFKVLSTTKCFWFHIWHDGDGEWAKVFSLLLFKGVLKQQNIKNLGTWEALFSHFDSLQIDWPHDLCLARTNISFWESPLIFFFACTHSASQKNVQRERIITKDSSYKHRINGWKCKIQLITNNNIKSINRIICRIQRFRTTSLHLQ